MSTGYAEPVLEASQDYKPHPDHSVDEEGEFVTIFARRALDTEDEDDFVIQLDKEFNLGYAYNGVSSSISISP